MMKDMFVHASNFDSQEKNKNELFPEHHMKNLSSVAGSFLLFPKPQFNVHPLPEKWHVFWELAIHLGSKWT